MLDAYIIDIKKREEEDREYDRRRPRVEIGVPDGSLIDRRKEDYEIYERRRDQQTPVPEYGPVPVDLDVVMQSMPTRLYMPEARF